MEEGLACGKANSSCMGPGCNFETVTGPCRMQLEKSECQRWQNRSSPVNPFRKFSNLLFSFFVSQYEAERSKSFVTKNTF